jgi:hypothetical protein
VVDSDRSNLSEQAFNKAIEVGLASQLQEAENIEVEIHSEPLQLIQGEVDSVRVQGQGVVTPQNLRIEEVILRSDHVAVNLLKTTLGTPRLKSLEDASVGITLTEADLNQILRSDYLFQELSPLTLKTARESLTLAWQSGSIQLLEKQQFYLEGELTANFQQRQQVVIFGITFRISQKEISLVAGEYLQETDLPLEITTMLLTKVNQLVQIRKLNIGNLQIVVDCIEIQNKSLVMQFSLEAET